MIPLIRHSTQSTLATPGAGWSYLCPDETCLSWRTEYTSEADVMAAWNTHVAERHPNPDKESL